MNRWREEQVQRPCGRTRVSIIKASQRPGTEGQGGQGRSKTSIRVLKGRRGCLDWKPSVRETTQSNVYFTNRTAGRGQAWGGKAWEALAGMRPPRLWFVVLFRSWFGGCGDGGTQLDSLLLILSLHVFTCGMRRRSGTSIPSILPKSHFQLERLNGMPGVCLKS